MTADMVMALLRQFLPVAGTLATALGWIAPEKVAPLVSSILAAAGPVMVLGGVIWTTVANTKKSIITSTANMPEVKEVVLKKDDVKANELERDTPVNVVVK